MHGIDSFRPRTCGSVGLWGTWMYKSSVWKLFLGIFLLSAELGGTLVCAKSQWSSWYNSDSPDSGSGDDESIERIALTFGLPCRRDDVTSVQCRRVRHQLSDQDDGKGVDEGEVFDHQWLHKGNVLRVPCNASGLVCRHVDQLVPASPPTPHYSSSSFALPRACADYEVRVQCRGGDTGNNNNQSESPAGITSHGAFIALVAGGSVVIPLIFVLILRLRKAKLARQRQREAQRPAQPSPRDEEQRVGQAEAVDAPPAYDLLFASPEPISVISGGPQTVGENLPDPLRSGTARLVEGRATGVGHAGQGAVNRGHGSVDSPASSAPSAEMVTEEESSEQMGGISRSSNSSNPNLLRPAISPSQPSPLSGAGVRRMSSASSSTSSSTLSASSTRALLTPVHSDHDMTHSDPPPAYDWPGHTLPRHVQTPGDVHSHTPSDSMSPEEPAHNPPPEFLNPPPTAARQNNSSRPRQRRFLGMHLSILDLMTVIYPDSDSTPTPPPTYDDALKILAVPVSPEVQVT